MNNVLVLGTGGHHDLFATLFKTEEIQHKHQFDTKYYVSEVYFHVYSLHEKLSQELLQKTQSLIFYIDSFETFKLIQSIHEYVSIFNLDTKVCVIDTKILNEHIVLEWCIDNGYELINIKETGHGRILEAIECTMWPSMEMKKREVKIVPKEVILEQTKEENKEFAKEKEIMENYFKNLKDGKDFDEVGDLEEQGYDDLVKDMLSLKMNTQNLSVDERKEKAAKIAMLLFHSLGGDDEEE
jgi:hypothetical protein